MGLLTLQDIFQMGYPDYEHDPSPARPCAQSGARHHAVSHGGPRRPCASLSRRPHQPHLVQLLPPSLLSRNARSSRSSAGWRPNAPGCSPVIIIMSSLPSRMTSIRCGCANVPLMTTLLFQAVRDTLTTLLADPKYLGAQPGIIAALHTWGQTLVLHPHIHCLVTGGGLTPDGQWKAVRNGFLAAGAGGHGRLPGQVPRRPAHGLGAGRPPAPRRAAAPAVPQPPEPPRPSEEDALERPHSGALPARDGGRHVSRAVHAGRADQKPAPGRL